MMPPDKKLQALGITLPLPPAPAAAYVPVTRSGDLLFVSGQVSSGPDGVVKGLLGGNMDVAAGQDAARLCAINILAQIAHNGGVTLDQVTRVLKLTVLVASTPEFSEQHLVANGASNLLVEVFGEKGGHARAAFGVASLPLGAAVEVDAIIEVSA